MDPSEIRIPAALLPRDGRFGSGPSKVRDEAIAALAERARSYMGHSHRHAAVREMVGRLKKGLGELFALPDGYEVVLGTGGSTVFWDAAVFCLIEHKSQHLVFGEFSQKFAEAVALAPHLNSPSLIEAEPGLHPTPHAEDEVDLYALTQNETSTGVAMPVQRVAPKAITAVDATSAAGGMRIDLEQCDVYYFAPQKGFASDAGLWIALCSPAALERIEVLTGGDRYVPPSLDLAIALDNSRKDQTYNTPPLATIFLTVQQAEWFLDNGGLEWAVGRSERSAATLYRWAERSEVAAPFVKDPAMRSPVVGTIDFAEAIDAAKVSAALRANGIVDTEPYRKLGRNQLRVGMYPAVDPDDVAALTVCIDHVIDVLGT